MRTYIKIYLDWENAVEPLSDEECGRLFRALLEYGKTGEKSNLQGNERFVFPMLANSIDIDRATYDRIVERNQKNGEKGGRPKQEKQETQENPKNQVGSLETQKNPKNPNLQEKRREEKRREENIYPPFVSDELRNAIEEYANMRTRMKKPLTDYARQLVIKKLEKWSAPFNDKERYMIECVQRSIENGWIGVFELTDFVDGRKKPDYDEEKFLDDYSAYVKEEQKKGVLYSDRKTMEEYFEEWIENERVRDGGDRMPLVG